VVSVADVGVKLANVRVTVGGVWVGVCRWVLVEVRCNDRVEVAVRLWE